MARKKGRGRWIQGAVKKPGAFTAMAKRAGKSVGTLAREKAHAPGLAGQRARFALNMRKIAARRKSRPSRQHRR
jgi:hypothetical protein